MKLIKLAMLITSIMHAPCIYSGKEKIVKSTLKAMELFASPTKDVIYNPKKSDLENIYNAYFAIESDIGLKEIIDIIKNLLLASNEEIIDKIIDRFCSPKKKSMGIEWAIRTPVPNQLAILITIKRLLEKESSEVILTEIKDCILYFNKKTSLPANIQSLQHIKGFIESIKPLIESKAEGRIKHIAYSMAVYNINTTLDIESYKANEYTYNDIHQALVVIAMKDPSKIQPDNRFIDICNLMFAIDGLSDLQSLASVSAGVRFKHKELLNFLKSKKVLDNVLSYLSCSGSKYLTGFNPSLNTQDPLILELTLRILIYLDLNMRTKSNSIVPIYFGQQTPNNILIDVLFKKLLTFEVFSKNSKFYAKIILKEMYNHIEIIGRWDYEKYAIAITPLLLKLNEYLNKIDIQTFGIIVPKEYEYCWQLRSIKATLALLFKANPCNPLEKVLGMQD